LFLAGCTALPASAPTAVELEASAARVSAFPLPVVKVTPGVTLILAHDSGTGLAATFHDSQSRAAQPFVLHAGDTIAVSIYEAGGQQLFGSVAPPALAIDSQPTAHSTTLPPETIERDGTVDIPFAGLVRVTGKTLTGARQAIADALKGKAAQPQVIVTLVNNDSNGVTVGGEVGTPGRLALTPCCDRILDAIAERGGSKYPAYETYVRVVRGSTVGSELLQKIASDPAENIRLHPQDQVFLSRNPQTFSVLGASQRIAVYNFDSERVTLVEAIARAGGPIENTGDVGGIYLFRFEPLAVAQQVVAASGGKPLPPDSGPIPVAYRLDLRNADQFFLAKAIEVHDKDLILVADASAVPFTKIISAVRGANAVARPY
jgi:polysaccharide export outer membrane protein